MDGVGSRLIALAVSLVGDPEAVRAEMKCSPEDFLAYSAARKQPAQPEVEALISIIVREQGNLIARNRDLIAQNRELIAQIRSKQRR